MITIHTDAPEVRRIANAAFPGYSGRTYKEQALDGPMSLESCWSGGSRDSFVLLNLDTLKTLPIPENGTPYANGGRTYKLEQLPEGAALVQHTIFCGKDLGVTIHVAPENLNRMALPAPVELTIEEKIVLAYTRGMKSSYNGRNRAQMARDESGLPLAEWERVKAECQRKGWLNKAGAITDAGRNVIQSEDPLRLKMPGFKRYGWE